MLALPLSTAASEAARAGEQAHYMYGMPPIEATVCLEEGGSSGLGVLDLENMWSSVDTEHSDRALAVERPGEDLEWASSPEVTLAESTIVGSQFHPLLFDPIAGMNPSSPTRPAQPTSHSSDISSDCEEHSSDQLSSSQTASALDTRTAREAGASDTSTKPTPSNTAEQEGRSARCPFCGNVPIVPGHALPSKEDRRPVGGVLEKGRYKVRAAPRKENRLAQW
jgi:hypothetical protein